MNKGLKHHLILKKIAFFGGGSSKIEKSGKGNKKHG